MKNALKSLKTVQNLEIIIQILDDPNLERDWVNIKIPKLIHFQYYGKK